MRRSRVVTGVRPQEISSHDGLAYSLWLPEASQSVGAGLLILHGAGSSKESHHDFARKARAAGFATLAFDQRGHGASGGSLGGGALDDIAAMADLLRRRVGTDGDVPVALRGSSMGGCLGVLAAERTRAAAVVAICPASPQGMRRFLSVGSPPFGADVPALDELLRESDLEMAVAGLKIPLLLLHAEGDEQMPVQQSRELAEHMHHPASRLITLPGGHHRSIQHDDELQALSLRFIEKALRIRRR